MENNFEPRLEMVCKTLLDNKGKDIISLEVGNMTVIADYFIVCAASSSTQVKTLCDEAEKALTATGEAPIRIEGYQAGRWIVMDYGWLLIHIFHEEEREYYNLERLWMDDDNCRFYSEEAAKNSNDN